MTFIYISGAAVFLYRKDSHRLEGVSTKQALHSLWSIIDASLKSGRSLLANLLIKNAVEVMSEVGNIDLCTKDRLGLGNNFSFEIQVSDNGPGLPEAVKSQLFPPNAGLVLRSPRSWLMSWAEPSVPESGKAQYFRFFCRERSQVINA
jgi:hypothetical protein